LLLVGEARQRQRLLLVPLELRLGLTPYTQAFVNVPFGWSNSEFAFLDYDEFSNTGGIGDVSAGLTHLILEGDEVLPDLLGTLAFSAPTGNSDIVSSLSTPGSTLGEGFWSLSADLTLIHTYDPVVLFYGGGYRHRFQNTFENDIEIDPGAQFYYRFGAGFAVNPRVTFSASFFGSFLAEDTVNDIEVEGGIREPMQLRLATTIVRDAKPRGHRSVKTVEPYVDFGLTDESIDTMFGISWTH
jgi:hypothetical protein